MQKHDWMVLWWSIYGDMSMNGGGRPEEVDAEAGGEGVVGARSGVAVPSSWRGTARRGLSRRCRSSLSWAFTRSWIEGEDVEETRSTLTKMIPPPPPPCYVTWVNHPKSLFFFWPSIDQVLILFGGGVEWEKNRFLRQLWQQGLSRSRRQRVNPSSKDFFPASYHQWGHNLVTCFEIFNVLDFADEV